MAFDGIVIAALTDEFKRRLTGGRIHKIYQPESDELILTIKNQKENIRLLLSASASLPLAYITGENKQNPLSAPNFCMLLRKHINGGRILSVTQPGMERIIRFEIEHLNDLGDRCTKLLIIELMGKHSNIIFCRPDGVIIDSIKHISLNVSSVREVLPGRAYFIPDTLNKHNPSDLDEPAFRALVSAKPVSVFKALYTSLTGISPLIGEELCTRASIDPFIQTESLNDAEWHHLYLVLSAMLQEIHAGHFKPNILYKDGAPEDFSVTDITCRPERTVQTYTTVSELLEHYYAEKNALTRIRQKSSDLRRIVNTALDRTRKKYDLQLRQMQDTNKRDKFKVYGELIHTYGYGLQPGEKTLKCLNYYTNEEIAIPLDTQLTAGENAARYFEKYNKLKRTYDALCQLTVETKQEIDHLESISTALDIALYEEDLTQIKEELVSYGYMKRRSIQGKNSKKQNAGSKPFHYISSDGFHIYVGKNNLQNEMLTFKVASGSDWWFHAKGIPGSHVIVKAENETLPDATFEEAARLAAYYSKGRDAQKVEVDYIQKKFVKKPAGAVLGFVIYHTNYSMLIEPDIKNIHEVKA